jgi:hypothetical protein
VEWDIAECAERCARERERENVPFNDHHVVPPKEIGPEPGCQSRIELHGDDLPRAHRQPASKGPGSRADLEHDVVRGHVCRRDELRGEGLLKRVLSVRTARGPRPARVHGPSPPCGCP